MNHELLTYKDGKLYWKESRGRVSKGQEAGRLTMTGYRHVCINGQEFYAHRLIWEGFNGPIPEGLEIDHVDRNRDNNNLANLRLVTPSENKLNRGISKNSTTKVKGVYWSKQKQKWSAEITRDSKKKFLGYYACFFVAVKARKTAESNDLS